MHEGRSFSFESNLITLPFKPGFRLLELLFSFLAFSPALALNNPLLTQHGTSLSNRATEWR
jgi:hypothetical protein